MSTTYKRVCVFSDYNHNFGFDGIVWDESSVPVVKPALVAEVTVPLVYLPLNTVPLSSDWLYIILAVIFTLLVTILVMISTCFNTYKAFALIVALTVVALTADQITGSHLIQNSVLGYDPMAGALLRDRQRIYGYPLEAPLF